MPALHENKVRCSTNMWKTADSSEEGKKMKNWLKCYHVFLAPWWMKALVYAVYPVLMIAGMCLAIVIVRDVGATIELVYTLTGNLFIMAELFFGYFIFGGVASKDSNKLEYLKTSVKGMPVLNRAVIVDALRRVLWIFVMQLVPLWLCNETPGAGVWAANAMVLLCVEAGLMIVRRTSSFNVFIVVLAIAWTVAGAFMGVGMFFRDYWWVIGLFYCAVVALIICSIRMVMRKARDSYYDDRSEKEPKAA